MEWDNNLYKIFDELKIKVPKKLLMTALSHPSITNDDETAPNYERLEFLGDSVLKLTMSEILYKKYPDYNEGRMTKIRSIAVSDNTLAKLGRKINLMDLIILGKGEKRDNGANKDSVIACVMEALMGAIYLSSGLNKAQKYISILFKGVVDTVDKNLDIYNAKAILQEYTQGKNKDLPQYKLLKEEGKAHNKTFFYEIIYQGEKLSQGSGKTKRDAQQDAAKSACIKLGIFKSDEINTLTKQGVDNE